VLSDLLRGLGFDIVEANNGEEALAQAQAQVPDLIATDIRMPVMDGLEATRRLRQLPAFQKTPIIIVSASAPGFDQQQSLVVGANAFLSKPININSLLQEIGRLLQLTWTHGQPTQESPEDATTGPLIPPPMEEIEVLYELALLGNMRDIAKRAAHVEALDEKYASFARTLRQLARGFESQAILKLVMEYRKKKSD
jgi:CheY-like chemotaxis protein